MSDLDDRLVVSGRQVTSRRRYELLNVNEVEHMIRKLLSQVDWAVRKHDDYVEDGECRIEIHVQQVIKKRDK